MMIAKPEIMTAGFESSFGGLLYGFTALNNAAIRNSNGVIREERCDRRRILSVVSLDILFSNRREWRTGGVDRFCVHRPSN